jgi:hypothetical protein
MKCSCCGSEDDIQHHHLYPKSQGCPDDLMVPLCYSCHRRAHGLQTNINHSKLTKEGLKRAKDRGVKLGWAQPHRNWDLHKEAVRKANAASVAARKKRAIDYQKSIGRDVLEWKESGLSLRQIAKRLESHGVKTPRGGLKWEAAQVKRLIEGFG